ncbi:histone-lysine N-methyltransferase trithorax [Cylas formicarius]|uniref:histone-lysine N-methyltransferase trithorax n=1 Tax=Cylas formicarius TaxID=197179 RepID=UPI0029588164|nr:histone-lysine N-methyltransferase trithorax [Cylas formicarius]
MGRSKFPGKPSRHCQKKRINVLPPNGELGGIVASNAVLTVISTPQQNKQAEEIQEKESESVSQSQEAKRAPHANVVRKLSVSLRKNERKRNFISKIRNKSTNIATRRNALSKTLRRRESTNFAGKFILPTRSVHSSRVIKPNKRFIDLNENLNGRNKIISKRSLKTNDDSDSIKCEDNSVSCTDKMTFTNGHRVILRQARLKLPNQIGTQGPFSSKLHNGPGTIICGVCGAVRYYRFVKQARKFNIYSCESCRKFISKQIKRQSVGNKTSNVILPCQLGQGTCYVPPVVRSQHWKITKCAYKSRCPACWLKMCLKAYHLPSAFKENLLQLLPINMRSLDLSFNNTLPPILWQKNVETPHNAKVNIEMNIKQRPIRFRPQKSQTPAPANAGHANSENKRQRIDLKGPRVKHVCRSASIVLGQPIATFSNGHDKKSDLDSQSEKKTSADAKTNGQIKCDIISGSDDDSTIFDKNSVDGYVFPQKEKSRDDLQTADVKDKDEGEFCDSICVNYSSEMNYENRFKYGFSVMGTENLLTNPICFLCGSAGFDNMLVCSVCCEPYHSFCVDAFPSKSTLTAALDWVCMRCAECEECKGSDKYKISCPKCRKIYHYECFNSNTGDANFKMLCKECQKCHDCGCVMAYNLFSFPGNMALCLTCIDKRKEGMYCPICHHSFESNSWSCRVLGCSKCQKWIHSECEKLTSEQYDILKLLPTSTSFTCSQCLNGSEMLWHKSLKKVMCSSFSNVIRLLAKNKMAKNIIKSNKNQPGRIKSSLGSKKTPEVEKLDEDNNNFKKQLNHSNSCDAFECCDDVDQLLINNIKTVQNIKSKLCNYNSVKKFNEDMEEALKRFHSDQILNIYKKIFQNVFPWFTDSHEVSESDSKYFQCHSPSHSREANFFLFPLPKTNDIRSCVLCGKVGDGLVHQESRLLFCGNNSWVHLNCAYWSFEVYEEIDDHLQNVVETIEKCRNINCTGCNAVGASIQCFICKDDSFHFMCARKNNWSFTNINKGCFCPKHNFIPAHTILKNDEDFEINRSIFIEQISKQELRLEAEEVVCSVGSLRISKLGKVEPILSNSSDVIVPVGFVCSRIFWSTIEPWKLIPYLVTTSVQNPNFTTLTVDKNFTIDHSLDSTQVEKAMRELYLWQREHVKQGDDVESEDEEEKNGTELLSPELTDTILEDIPHDILDGISVQDIFPNFSYEDVLSFDSNNTDNNADTFVKKVDEEEHIDLDSKCIKTRSERIPRVAPLSLALNCKLDTAVPKRQKMLLLQVDGTFDESSSSECESPTDASSFGVWKSSEEPVTCDKCQCTYRTQASYKRHLDSCEVICTSESDSENFAEFEADGDNITNPIVVADEAPQTIQPLMISSFESYQSQVQTSLVNVIPEAQSQPQPVTIQPTLTLNESQNASAISLPVPICVGTPIVQPSIEFQQPQPQPQVTLQPVLVQRQRPPRSDPTAPIIVQHLQPTPTTGVFPFMDTFQQPAANNIQYVTTITPAPVNPVPTQQLVQILPSLQPTTVIVQQPQQFVLDSSGTLSWTQPPPQPIYYGFETIVQNTVMQSQQFLPNTMSGVLTANSSYSTTTQVFQTSKLEPVIDMSSNGFLFVNPQQLELSQYAHNPIAAPTVVTSQPSALIYSQPSVVQKPIQSSHSNCISLPNAPFVADQGIPMNIVPPIPKQPSSHTRPMSRVLPMPTKAVKVPKKSVEDIKIFADDRLIEKASLLKLDDKKKMFAKEMLKVIDSPKTKMPRLLENAEFKLNNVQVTMNVSRITNKAEELRFKEFEPAEKIQKLLSTDAVVAEIETPKLDLIKKPVKLQPDKKSIQTEAVKPLEMPDISYNPLETQKATPVDHASFAKINSIDHFELRKVNKETLYKFKEDVPKFESDKITVTDIKIDNLLINESQIFAEESNCKVKIVSKQPTLIAPLRPLKPHAQLKDELKPQDVVKLPLVSEPLPPKQPSNKREPEPNHSPSILYTVENKEGFKFSSTSITDCWTKVIEAVQQARVAHNMPPLKIPPADMLKSVQLLGLKSNHLRYLIEQLPDVSKCRKYKPLFNFSPHQNNAEKADHPYGSARCEPCRTKNAEPYDMFRWLSSKHRQPFNTSLDQQNMQSRRVNNLPMAMKFRNLKLTSKWSVGVYRSNIHGRGLFCLRDIEPGEMVIEYAGEVIRSVLTDKREKLYNSKGIGCYMFRVDDNFVVDATMKGNAARFINHSCDPNCYSKVVEILGHKHIVIFALRRILSGEELTYDYKFPFEEDKIPCTCGAKRCRQFLN